MRRRPPRSTQGRSSAASDVYKRQAQGATVAACASAHGDELGQLVAEIRAAGGTALPLLGDLQQADTPARLIGSAAVANVRRIQRYLQARLQEEMKQREAQTTQDCAQDALAPSFFWVVRGFFARLLRPTPVFMPGLAR